MGLITNTEYVLIAIGLLLIFAYGIGLILLAIIAWRIGTRMETLSEEDTLSTELEPEEESKQSTESPSLSQNQSLSNRLGFQKTYKEDEYSEVVLEDGK